MLAYFPSAHPSACTRALTCSFATAASLSQFIGASVVSLPQLTAALFPLMSVVLQVGAQQKTNTIFTPSGEGDALSNLRTHLLEAGACQEMSRS